MDNSEFDRYEKSNNKKNKKNKKKLKQDKKEKIKFNIDDLIDPNKELTDIQRVMKKNRELMLEIEILKKKLKE